MYYSYFKYSIMGAIELSKNDTITLLFLILNILCDFFFLFLDICGVQWAQ